MLFTYRIITQWEVLLSMLDLPLGYYPIFINPPHPFSIVLDRFWYFIQDLLRTIEPLENNRKWVWWVYNNVIYQTGGPYWKKLCSKLGRSYDACELPRECYVDDKDGCLLGEVLQSRLSVFSPM